MAYKGRLKIAGLFRRAQTQEALERARAFGMDYFGIDVKPLVAPIAISSIRKHVKSNGGHGNKEEVFFLLAAAALHRIPHEIQLSLKSDLRSYRAMRSVSDVAYTAFMSRWEQLSLDRQDYWEWANSAKTRDILTK
jgi:hypothetical protein